MIDKKKMALSQIFILIIGIFAFSYILGSEFRIVSASVDDEEVGCDYPGVSYTGGKGTAIVSFSWDGKTYTLESRQSDVIILSQGDYLYYKRSGEWKKYNTDMEEIETEFPSDWKILAENVVECYDDLQTEGGEKSPLETCDEGCRENGYESGSPAVNSASCSASGGSELRGVFSDVKDAPKVCCCKSSEVPPEEQQENENLVNPSALSEVGGLAGGFTGQEQEDRQQQAAYDACISAGNTAEECSAVFQNGGSETDRLKAPFGWESGAGRFFGHLLQGFIWAGAVIGTMQAIKQFLPERYANILNSLTWALGGGVLAGKLTIGITDAAGASKKASIISGVSVGVVTAAIIFLALFKKKTQETITFTCSPWEAPTGGDKCEECNKQGALPCSEYQCRSLGQACELINVGTDKEKCAWINRGDVNFPTIEPWEDALLNNYEYTPDNQISPPDRGVFIDYTGEEDTSTMDTGDGSLRCVPAFTPLSFGVTLDEPGKCKIDVLSKDNYEDMNFFFSGGLLLYNHSYALSLPGSSTLEAEGIEIENEGEYSVYVRCQDANGNANTANFVFNFCVDKNPDTTAPLIVDTDPLNGLPFAYEQLSIESTIYINEPVEACKWSHIDQDYSAMEGDFDCTNADTFNVQGDYSCKAKLDGLKDREENKFYFRCEDKSGNINEESYEYTLIGTQPLVIDWVKPEEGELIRDSTDAVKVTLEAKTSAGYNEGEANCYYSETGDDGSYIMFLNTDSYEHSQELWLDEGEHTYYIKCIDLGGNSDVKEINFEVETDSSPPIVVRAYHEETYLKIVTNEAARCVYDTTYEDYPCDYLFEDGISMTTIEDVNHYVDWTTKTTFYIKCEDEYGKQPDPDECSIIVRPSDIEQE